jgi:hypothetical protein
MPDTAYVPLAIFALTYAVLGFGALPPLRIDRTGEAPGSAFPLLPRPCESRRDGPDGRSLHISG